MEIKPSKTDYQSLLQTIGQRYEQGRASISAYVNSEIVHTYWQIGQWRQQQSHLW